MGLSLIIGCSVIIPCYLIPKYCGEKSLKSKYQSLTKEQAINLRHQYRAKEINLNIIAIIWCVISLIFLFSSHEFLDFFFFPYPILPLLFTCVLLTFPIYCRVVSKELSKKYLGGMDL